MQRRVPPAEVSVGVNSKEELLRFKVFDKNTCFVILVSLIAIMSVFVLVHFEDTCNLNN